MLEMQFCRTGATHNINAPCNSEQDDCLWANDLYGISSVTDQTKINIFEEHQRKSGGFLVATNKTDYFEVVFKNLCGDDTLSEVKSLGNTAVDIFRVDI